MTQTPRKFTADAIHIKQADIKYQGFFNIAQYQLEFPLFQGGYSTCVQREVCKRRPAVGVLAYDKDLDRIVLVEQIRIGALNDPSSPWLLEIIAGLIESGESPEEVAKRELFEEAGLECTQLEKMLDYWVSPGSSDEHFILFLAHINANHANGIHGLVDEGENILIHSISTQQAFEWLEQGFINSAPTIIALQWLKLHLAKSITNP